MMKKRDKQQGPSWAEEFSTLVGQLEQEGYHGIPKAMTPEGLEVLAFDLEERDKLARARAWIKSQKKTKPQVAKTSAAKAKRSKETKEAPGKKTDVPELTPEQQQMEERIRKQQGKDINAATVDGSKPKKAKPRRRKQEENKKRRRLGVAGLPKSREKANI